METSEWVSGLTPNDHFLRRHFTNEMHEPCPRCNLHVHLWNSTLTSRGYFAWQMSPQERNSIATARVNAVKAFARDVSFQCLEKTTWKVCRIKAASTAAKKACRSRSPSRRTVQIQTSRATARQGQPRPKCTQRSRLRLSAVTW